MSTERSQSAPDVQNLKVGEPESDRPKDIAPSSGGFDGCCGGMAGGHERVDGKDGSSGVTTHQHGGHSMGVGHLLHLAPLLLILLEPRIGWLWTLVLGALQVGGYYLVKQRHGRTRGQPQAIAVRVTDQRDGHEHDRRAA
jgi:hypothetical protein